MARGTTSRWQRNELGQGAVTLAVVAVVLVAAVALLLRTATLANNIDRKIENIAQTGRGINEATDAILELDTTNNLGRSILETSKPLVGTLDQIEGLAVSINETALDVNGSVRGINGKTREIQATARRLNGGVESINRNVDTLIGLVRAVKTDTGNILTQTRGVEKNAACIERALTGSAAANNCR
jgi:uncharacterized protein YoxC